MQCSYFTSYKEREAKIRNTKVMILAQGDNQQKQQKQTGVATKKIGLTINDDETLKSNDFLIYGKVIIYGWILNNSAIPVL